MFTWGVNERVDETTGRVSYDMSLSFTSKDEGDPVGDYYHKLKHLQEKVLDDAVTNSKLWFGKAKMSREVAEAMMYPILKFPKDKNTGEPDMERPATVKLKLQYWDEKFNVELYNMDRTPLFGPNVETDKTPLDLVPAHSHVKGLMQCSGVWFAGGRFGVTWRFVQGQVEQPVRIKGFCMMSDSDDDDDEPKLALQVSTEDEEDVKPKKKIVRRKKKTKSSS